MCPVGSCVGRGRQLRQEVARVARFGLMVLCLCGFMFLCLCVFMVFQFSVFLFFWFWGFAAGGGTRRRWRAGRERREKRPLSKAGCVAGCRQHGGCTGASAGPTLEGVHVVAPRARHGREPAHVGAHVHHQPRLLRPRGGARPRPPGRLEPRLPVRPPPSRWQPHDTACLSRPRPLRLLLPLLLLAPAADAAAGACCAGVAWAGAVAGGGGGATGREIGRQRGGHRPQQLVCVHGLPDAP